MTLTIPRGSHLYRCLEFAVPGNTVYDVKTNHYPSSQASYTDVSVAVTGDCYVQFHKTDFDKIPISASEESLTISEFKFRHIFIGNENSTPINVRLLLLSDNEVSA